MPSAHGNADRDTWSKVFGENTSLLPALTVLFKTFVGGLSYAIILGDSFSSIATLAGLPPALARSNTWIYLLSAFVLLPLSLMRDLSSLAVGSIIGTAGTLCALRHHFSNFATREKKWDPSFVGRAPVSAERARLFPASLVVLRACRHGALRLVPQV